MSQPQVQEIIPPSALAELEDMTFPRPRGNRPEPLAIEVLRVLELKDLQALGTSVVAVPQRLLQIRQPHHQLARTLCEGKEIVEASLITGYAPGTISQLLNDPAFQELMCYYGTQREQVFVDTLERLKSLGLTSHEELQRRLDEAPEKFTNTQLMELVEMALLKPEVAKAMSRQAPSNGPATNIQVTFVASEPRALDITPHQQAAE